MTDIESKLRTSLYRAFCPDSTELGEYQLGMLSANRRREIRAHLQDCPHCSRELEQLERFMTAVEGDLEPGLGEKLRQMVAHLVSPGAGPDFAMAGLRGEAGGTLNYTTEGYEVVLDIQTDPAQPDRKVILGLLMGDEPSGFEAWLYEDQALSARVAVDEFGNFTLQHVPPGEYNLVLRGAGMEINIEPLSIA